MKNKKVEIKSYEATCIEQNERIYPVLWSPKDPVYGAVMYVEKDRDFDRDAMTGRK